MRTSRGSFPAVLGILLWVGHAATAEANGHILDVQQIADHGSLELKTTLVAPDRLLVADLFDNGSANQIDLYGFTAAPGGVALLDDSIGLGVGEVFGLGDWCVGPSSAAVPFVDRNGGSFDLQVARYALSTGATGVITVSDSLADRYTTTDCSVLDDGTFILSALNFDDGTVDYFSSPDEGTSWSLEGTYSPSGGVVIGPFSGGFRPTSGARGNHMGTVAQIASGEIIAGQVDPLTGTPLGEVPIFNHLREIGNGFLKECDGLVFEDFAFGLCNRGDAAWGGSIDLSNGGLKTVQLNLVGVGARFDFQGVSVSAGVFGGVTQFHTFTDRHVVTPFDGSSWGTPFEVTDYPFSDEGGPVDSSAAESLARIFIAGMVGGGGAGNVYPAVATLDPTLIEAPPGGAGVAIPTLSSAALAVLILLFAVAGLWGLLRG